MLLHQTQAIQRFLSSLTKFDPMLTPRGTKNHNFDLPLQRVGASIIVKIIEFFFQ